MRESLGVAASWMALCSAVAIGIVFLFTKPPAIDRLSPEALLIIGVVTVVAVFGQTAPTLYDLFNPEIEEPPIRPADDPPSASGGSSSGSLGDGRAS